MNTPRNFATSPDNPYYGDIVVSGTAADEYGVSRVEVMAYSASSGAELWRSPEDAAIGTNSWSVVFRSTDYVASSGNVLFGVRAWDRSGNVSTHFYHDDDLRADDDLSDLLVTDLHQIEIGRRSSPSLQTLRDARRYLPESDESRRVQVYIDQDENLPVITVSYPDQDSSLDDNVLPPNARFVGLVEDPDGIDLDSVRIRFRSGDDTTEWYNRSSDRMSLSGNQVVRWTFENSSAGIELLEPGVHELQVEATDLLGFSRTTPWVGFEIDAGAPYVEITSPQQGQYLNSRTVEVSGGAVGQNDPLEVSVRVNEHTDYTDPVQPAGDGSWNITLEDVPTGQVTLRARVRDASGKQTFFNTIVTIDDTPPTAQIVSPTKGRSVNNFVRIVGSADDNLLLDRVELLVGKQQEVIPLDGTYNWEYLLDSPLFSNPDDADEISPNIWELPLQVRVYDRAGNVGYSDEDYYIVLDQDGDKPQITNIISPQEEYPSVNRVAGSLNFTGTAVDDDAIKRVEMQLIALVDGQEHYIVRDFTASEGAGNPYELVDPANPDTTNPDESWENAWRPINGTSLWSARLNEQGELYSLDDLAGISGHTGNFLIRVRAVDQKLDGSGAPSVVGDAVDVRVQFDDTLPAILNMNYEENEYVSGEFTLEFDAVKQDDGSGAQISSIRYSLDNGTNWNNYSFSPGTNVPVSIPIDSTDYFPDTSDRMRIRIRVEDTTGYLTERTLSLYVDNSFPEVMSSETRVDGSAEQLGDMHNLNESPHSSVFLSGVARDPGTGGNIRKVEVYFVRGDDVLHIGGGVAQEAADTDFGGGQGFVPYTDSEDHKIKILRSHNLGDNGKRIRTVSNDYIWEAEVDTTALGDGPVEIHYVAWDNADNRTHGMTEGFIQNYKPVIGDVTVGTDLNYDGEVDEAERFTYNARFNARGFIYIEPEVAGGNDPNDIEILHDDEVLTPVVGDHTYSLQDIDDGEDEFIIRVTDAVGITVEKAILVAVDQEDTTPPTITIDGLPEPAMNGSLRAGHVEAVSPHNEGRPSVSGEVIISGSAGDDQRIQELRLSIPGIQDNVVAADWDTDVHELRSRIDGFEIVSQSLSVTDGHEISWELTWNTAELPNVAGFDVPVTLTAQDFRTGSPPPTEAAQSYDVVPYITGLRNTATNQGLAHAVLRSATGAYSIRQFDGESFVVDGFNLPRSGTPNSAVRIFNNREESGTALANPEIESFSDGATSIEVSTSPGELSHSGYLQVSANGVASINNRVDNSETDWNPRSEQWNDDRYLHVWGVTRMLTGVSDQTFYYPSMVVRNGQPVFSYTDDNDGAARITTGDQSSARRVGLWFERQTALAYNDAANSPDFMVSTQDAFSGGNIGFLQLNTGRNANAAVGTPTNNNRVMELVGTDYLGRQLNRFQYPNLIATGTNANTQIYLTYYDAHPDARYIRFFSFDVRGATNNFPASNLTRPANDASIASNGNITVPGTEDGASSRYHSLIMIDGDIAVVYYDETDQNLKMSYSSDHTDDDSLADPGSSWGNMTLDADDFQGRYVSAAADDSTVYVAYFDGGNASLKFLTIDWATKTVSTPVVVDSYLSTGSWTNIELIDGLPHISYYADSYNGTRSPIRLAYPVAANGRTAAENMHRDGAGEDERYTGNWEAMAVPAASPPRGGMEQFNRTQIGTYSAEEQNLPVVGWLADRLEYARLMPNDED